jgi:hypothetical protein
MTEFAVLLSGAATAVTTVTAVVIAAWNLRGHIDTKFTETRVEIASLTAKVSAQNGRVGRTEDHVIRLEERLATS